MALQKASALNASSELPLEGRLAGRESGNGASPCSPERLLFTSASVLIHDRAETTSFVALLLFLQPC